MKKIFVLTAAIFLSATASFSQTLAENTTVRSCMFMLPGEGAYMETYLIAGANAIEYLPEKPRGFKGAVEVQILIVEGDKVVNFDKYQLNTPIVYDTNAINFSIMDQKRLFIPNTTVSVEVKVIDVNDPENFFSSTEVFTAFVENSVQISDIQFVESYKETSKENTFTKNGLELQPHPINFFSSEKKSIIFYGEIYNSDKYLTDDQFLSLIHI